MGELNDSQKAQWCSALDVFDESHDCFKQMSLFPDNRTPPPNVSNPIPDPALPDDPAPSAPVGRLPAGDGAVKPAGSGFLLGTPTPGQPLSNLEDQLFAEVQEQVEVKLSRDGEDLQVLTRSGGRCDKERSMRRCKLKKLWSLVDVRLPQPRQEVSEETFGLSLNIGKLRKVRRSEGTYLLRTKLTAGNPEELWKKYIVLTEVEQAFKQLKNDLDIRPVYH